MKEKEEKGWNLKFQNYWSYTVAADSHLDKSRNMCERLFIHIGDFRKKASDHFKEIVDSMHRPDIAIAAGLKPIAKSEDDDALAVYLDEEDDRLYVAPE